jgi:hypothetical protein
MTVLPHWPSAPQVCTPFPEHIVVPGTHTPPHDPFTQPYGHGFAAPHVPVTEHVSTPTVDPPSSDVAQRVAFGAHSPWHDALPLVPTHA